MTAASAHTRYACADDTWLERECDGQRRARARFPDGKLRIVRARGTADTWFSVAVIGRLQTPNGPRHAYITAADNGALEVRYCDY